jgi:hypothetical protein
MATEWRATAKICRATLAGKIVLLRNSWVIHGNGTIFDIIPPGPIFPE